MDVFQDTKLNVKDETGGRKVIRHGTEHSVSTESMLS